MRAAPDRAGTRICATTWATRSATRTGTEPQVIARPEERPPFAGGLPFVPAPHWPTPWGNFVHGGHATSYSLLLCAFVGALPSGRNRRIDHRKSGQAAGCRPAQRRW